ALGLDGPLHGGVDQESGVAASAGGQDPGPRDLRVGPGRDLAPRPAVQAPGAAADPDSRRGVAADEGGRRAHPEISRRSIRSSAFSSAATSFGFRRSNPSAWPASANDRTHHFAGFTTPR